MSSDWLDQEASTPPSTMLTASFNQDGGCLAIGLEDGFEIFNLAPFQNSVSRTLGGSLGRLEMLFRCNLIAIAIGELSFRQVVLTVKLRRDAIAVALRDRVYVYHLSDLSLRDKIYTTDNPHGLLSLSTAVQDMVLCCPSVTDGHVRVELYGLRKTVLIEAHDSKLRALALTQDGTQLATASVKGTVIRVFSVANSQLLHEFRRGVERVTMTCLAWSWDHRHVACCSEKGTAHVFAVQRTDGTKPKKSWYDTVRKRMPGGDLQHSISQIRGVPHPIACAFLPDVPNTLAVVGWDVDGNGVVLLSDFSQEEAVRTGYHVLAKSTKVDLGEGPLRRKRLLGYCTAYDSGRSGRGKLYVGERVEVLENQMKKFGLKKKKDFLNVFGVVGAAAKG
ncbi:phosphatidylinositol-3-5-bisphosphate binding protein [Fragilaria crotonensis]|nr:phosphatidylinositol-3-5-bisphosphate binding protein [Fragilaria crotonensis]